MPDHPSPQRLGVVLIGHGAPATDCPPRLIGELMSLEWRGDAAHGAAGHDHHGTGHPRAAELDAQIRNWPRTEANDPYKAGLERLASALRPLLPTELFAIGYNEFCRPTIAEAIGEVIRAGAQRVLVMPTMLTPGGVHSERDIPQALEAVRRQHPAALIEYAWPFDLRHVAELLAGHVRQAAR
jgi:sirohydrochlorin cobaltochelatase